MLEIIINTANKSRSVRLLNHSSNDKKAFNLNAFNLILMSIIAIMAVIIVVLFSRDHADNRGEIRFNFDDIDFHLAPQFSTHSALYSLPLTMPLNSLLASSHALSTPKQPVNNQSKQYVKAPVVAMLAPIRSLASPTLNPSQMNTILSHQAPTIKSAQITTIPPQIAQLKQTNKAQINLKETPNTPSKKQQIPEHFQTYTISKGDTLSAIFRNKLKLPYHNIKKLLAADERALSKIKPGQKLYYFAESSKNPDSERILKELMLKEGQYIHHFLTNKDEGFDYRKTAIEMVWQENYFQGVIQTTLTKAIKKSGLNTNVAAQVANVLGERLDFRRQVRIGDEFSVLVKQGFREGKKISDKVHAIYYKGEKAELLAVLHKDGLFYDAQGQSVQLDFLKRPYVHKKGMWISAYFGLRSVHPVTGKRNQAHNGTDYGMNIGTPILAAADGIVISSKVDKKGGEMLTLKHNEKYTTKYLHLSKRIVKKGDQVKQGDTIALSGNTGESTGPHLHYGFYINDQPFDSERNDPPKTIQLSTQDTATLNANTQLWQTKLASMLDDKIQTAAK